MTKYPFLLLLFIWCQANATVPPCAPYVPATSQKLASGTTWQVEQAQYGWHFYWWCEDKVGMPKPYGYTCSYEGNECNTLKGVQWIRETLNLADAQKLPSVTTAWNANIKYDCDDPASLTRTDYVGKICTEHNWLYANRKAAWLANYKPPIWKVKPPVAPATTRPAYTLINGILGTREMARVVAWKWCDHTKPYLFSGSNAYMQYDATGYVTLCFRDK